MTALILNQEKPANEFESDTFDVRQKNTSSFFFQ